MNNDQKQFGDMRNELITFVERERYNKQFQTYDIVDCILVLYIEYLDKKKQRTKK